MGGGSKSRKRTHVRVVLDVMDDIRGLLPHAPVVVRRKFMPILDIEFNQPLTDEEKRKLKDKFKRLYGGKYHVEVWDEEEGARAASG